MTTGWKLHNQYLDRNVKSHLTKSRTLYPLRSWEGFINKPKNRDGEEIELLDGELDILCNKPYSKDALDIRRILNIRPTRPIQKVRI